MSERSAFARLPKVDAVLEAPRLRSLGVRRELKRRVVQDAVQNLRDQLHAAARADTNNAGEVAIPSPVELADTVARQLEQWTTPRPKRVLNATGVILHTNLGRTPLSAATLAAMTAAGGYCDLEVGLADGQRGSRFVWLRPFIAALMGTQDAHVVNNNAGALLLACTALGGTGGVVLSRGQMVEIGGSFRVATMAAAGGCRVVAVGSTNRTHPKDYEEALQGVGPDSDGRPATAVLWAHQSNFSQQGFVREVPLPELAQIAKRFDVPFIVDLGSGSLGTGLPTTEPTITEYLEQGADLVLASGDKLLGGPQAGIIAGRADFVQRCRTHPMARALRLDKTTLAGLHATLAEHASDAVPNLPLHNMINADNDTLRARALAICEQLGWEATAVIDSVGAIGGGSLPTDTVPSVAIIVPTVRPSQTAKRLRLGEPAVVGHIVEERLLLDLRTIAPDQDSELVAALTRVPSGS